MTTWFRFSKWKSLQQLVPDRMIIMVSTTQHLPKVCDLSKFARLICFHADLDEALFSRVSSSPCSSRSERFVASRNYRPTGNWRYGEVREARR
ncbi:hypothetical protein PoB_006723300 [Plakobranchus ocellatus]|uniref:Uncharacterized protein n=1 Tax=Plakobranchus ocellatus TaxID=259542 RepID=A0AAV4D978_9GAST|nr:hypothetical protein PoB_006723300 [Plakobranchus ocellatus]